MAAGAVTSLILTKRYFTTTETGMQKLKMELYTVYTTPSVVQHLFERAEDFQKEKVLILLFWGDHSSIQ